MDAGRFDALSCSLAAIPSRRGALRLLGALSLGLLAHIRREPAWAKSGKCRPRCNECERCKKGNCQRKNGKKRCEKGKCKPKTSGTPCAGGGTCQARRCVLPFCTGRNSCEDGNPISTCQRAGAAQQCVCVATADTGAPFCALNNAGMGENCLVTPCSAGQTCVDFTGGACPAGTVGGTACALPCPEPL
jgi:hypothetical protein